MVASRLLPIGLALSIPALGQEITTIVETGDVIAGIGTVHTVRGLGVSDAGQVSVHVFTDNPVPELDAGLVDNNAVPIVWEGAPVADPPGAVVRSFNAGHFFMNSAGRTSFLIGMLGTTGTGDDEGIYYDLTFQRGVQEGSVSTAPELPAGTIYGLPVTPKINNIGGICFHALLDDPNVPGTSDSSALIVFDIAAGTESAPYKQGDILTGQTADIRSFEFDFHGLAYNAAGQIFFGAELSSGARVLYLNDTKIAETGETSPFGSTYANLATGTLGLDLNDKGDLVFMAKLGSGGTGVILNDKAFLQTGGVMPSIAPFNLAGLGQPIFLGEDGSVAWMGIWNAPVQRGGLFIDYNLVVETGVTTVGGVVIDQLSGLDQSFTVSDSGQYLLFLAGLASGVQGAFLIDLWN